MKQNVVLLLLFIPFLSFAQTEHEPSLDSLKKEILQLRTDVDQIQLNLATSHKKFKRGILAATIGYSVTIAGGLMLGRENDDVGQALLIAGGVTGITGTILMVDAFKYLNRTGAKKR
jgi:hypothetical protein